MLAELISQRNEILDSICKSLEASPESAKFESWKTAITKSSEDVESFLKSIYWSHFYEQLWLNYSTVEDDSDKTIQSKIRENITHTWISDQIHASIFITDKSKIIDSGEREECKHPLGCIGSKNLVINPSHDEYPFLTKFTKIELDHLWPKSRTPHHHESFKVDSQSLDLCQYHNLDKMNSMSFLINNTLTESK